MRIKNIFLCFAFLAGLFACREDELVWYSEQQDGLHFYQEDSEDEETAKLEIIRNFATENKDGYYYGDSLIEIRLDKIYMALQGFPTPDERPYKLKTVLVEGQDSTKVAEVLFDDYYSLAPNSLRDTISFRILRPKERGTYVVGITVDTEGSDAFFTEGVEEQSVLRVEVQDVYEKPACWDDRWEWLGDFSEEKYAFMVTYSHKPFDRGSSEYNETDRYNVALRAALDAYNTAHPEEVKPFDFPITSKTVWWDEYYRFLGEYSQEKFDYVLNYVRDEWGEEEFLPGAKLEYLNICLRKELQWEDPKPAFDFPRVTDRSPWWNDAVLGEFSADKQEFAVEKLFDKLTRVFQEEISDETWTWGGSVLRYILENDKSNGMQYEFELPIPESAPSWWGEPHNKLFGEWTWAKQDVIVNEVVNIQLDNWSLNINPLMNFDEAFFDNNMPRIRQAVSTWNQWIHPDDPIEIPAEDPSAAPGWWKANEEHLGDYSPEKKEFVASIIARFNQWIEAPYNACDFGGVWNPIFRFELEAYNRANPDKPYEFTFPEEDVKWEFWDRLSYLGEYSESKKVFVCLYLKDEYNSSVISGGAVDGWSMGDGADWLIEGLQTRLLEAYATEYENFMQEHPSAEPFSFPEPTE